MIDKWYWHKAVPWLTLDQIAPFYEAMGLQMWSEPKAVLEVLRKALVAAAPVTPETGLERLAAKVEPALRAAFGPEAVDRFEQWLMNVVFSPAEFTDNAWLFLLGMACIDVATWSSMDLPAGKSEALRLAYLKAGTDEKTAALFENARDAKLSEWDLGIYGLFLLYREDHLPLATAMSVIERWRLLTFLERTRDSVTPEEMQKFLNGAQKVMAAKRLSVTLTLPTRFREPLRT